VLSVNNVQNSSREVYRRDDKTNKKMYAATYYPEKSRGYWELKENARDRNPWGPNFVRGYGLS